ncbi:sensor domain-containing diguanylate cyclase [Curvibacter lanceolatus]|uniref:sensor domain-containing diguanylate cyclase n=1 Tax=Curvibacter lanceolatus TaxID=86182 RepID=UPI0012F73750|nr:sensor domain-containing diguanylate cyclase [Curvibacter lanceolatus]
MIEDITARRNAELALGELRHQLEQRVSERTRELEQVNRQQHLMLDNDLVGIVKLRGRHALWHNQAFTHIFGGVAGEAIGRSAREVYFDNDTFARIGREAYPILTSGGTYRTQLPMRHKSGSVLWIDLSGAMLSTTTKESIWMLLDITQMKSRHDEIATMAFHDPLTGLANRVLLNQRLEQAMANATRQKQQVALCFLDLDGFKAINDQLGHEAGDEVLLAVAARLSRSVRTIDTVARLGGDEFVVLLTQINPSDQITFILDRAMMELEKPIPLKGGRVTQVRASAGVAFFPEQAQTAAALIDAADQAMYAVKRARKEPFNMDMGAPTQSS